MSAQMRKALERIAAYDVPDAHEMIQIARRALAEQPAQGVAVTFDQWLRTEAHPHLRASGPLATEWLRAIYEAGQRNAPPAPAVPDGWGLAAFKHKWEACDTQCECKVCGTVFGAAPLPSVQTGWELQFSKPQEQSSAQPEHCSHARTNNGRVCCDCGAEVDPATQNFGQYGAAPPAPKVPDDRAIVPKRMTREMQHVVEREEWEWADLLAAAGAVTEAEHAAILNAPSAPAAPDGWRLVPINATPAMLEVLKSARIHEWSTTRAVYAALLAAAPEVPRG